MLADFQVIPHALDLVFRQEQFSFQRIDFLVIDVSKNRFVVSLHNRNRIMHNYHAVGRRWVVAGGLFYITAV